MSDTRGYARPSHGIGEVPLRDEPLHPLQPVDVFAAHVLDRLRGRDHTTSLRLSRGLLSPKEVARVAGEVAAQTVCVNCHNPLSFLCGCWQDADGYACPAIRAGDDRHIPGDVCGRVWQS